MRLDTKTATQVTQTRGDSIEFFAKLDRSLLAINTHDDTPDSTRQLSLN